MRNDFESNYLAHWGIKLGGQKKDHKYKFRIKLGNGKYRYFYSLKEYLAYMKQSAKDKLNDLKSKWNKKEDIAADKIQKGVEEGEKAYDKYIGKNKYATDNWNYNQKIKEIEKTKEWQDIVKRKDPEYVYKDKNGNIKYDIDSYLAKKKHPGLDVADDIISGRKVSINKIEKDSTIAGAVDYAKTYATVAAIGTKFMLEKFKFSQGSYNEEVNAAINYAATNKESITKAATRVTDAMNDEAKMREAVSEGEKYVDKALKVYGDNKAVIDDISEFKNQVSTEDYKQMKEDYDRYKKEYDKMQKELEEYKKAQKQKLEQESEQQVENYRKKYS